MSDKKELKKLVSEFKDFVKQNPDNFISNSKPMENKPTPKTQLKKADAVKIKPKVAPAKNKAEAIENLAQEILICKKCPLGKTRIKAVPGEGNIDTKLMFIGEGPGFEEDHQGRPFIGRAGKLLDKMIIAMGLKREEVFIANMVKCHPMVDPSNNEKRNNDREPDATEIAYCRHFVEKQISLINPDIVVALGAVSGKSLIGSAPSLSKLRGGFHNLELDSVELSKPIKIIATFHPAALLRNPNWKKDCWQDLQIVIKELGLTPTAKIEK